ncbi:MAG: hypothetical protein KAI63_02125, partial [Planctomycetes bacterium]|nr:hypothetical protein [Planctomycetota bacterium]
PADSYPSGSPGIITSLKVDRTGAGSGDDADIDAVKLWRDEDSNGQFDDSIDILISTPVSFTSGSVTITLLEAQPLSDILFLTYDISPGATTGNEAGAELTDYTYYTVLDPHTRLMDSSDAFPIQTPIAPSIGPSMRRCDTQIAKAGPSPVYLGNDIYNNSGLGQTETTFTNDTNYVSFYIKLENDGVVSANLIITGMAGNSNWSVTYYDALIGGTDITFDVVNNTEVNNVFSVAVGTPKDLRVEIGPNPGSPPPVGNMIDVLMTAWVDVRPDVKDVIKAITGNEVDKADALVSQDGTNYVGEDIYYPPDYQSINNTIGLNTVVTYYVKIENEGGSGIPDQISVTGAASSGSWTITYYNDEIFGNGDGSDITTAIVNGTWATGSLNNGEIKIVRVEAETTEAGTNNIEVWAAPQDDLTKSDQVTISLNATPQYQTDLLVGISNDTWPDDYLTDDLYETGSPVTQTKTTGIIINGVGSYYVRIQNDSNLSESFRITGIGSGVGTGGSQWTVTYYYGAENITSQVLTSNGWFTPPIAASDTIAIIVEATPDSGVLFDQKDIIVSGISGSDPNKIDRVKIVSYLGESHQPDGWLQLSTDPFPGSYIGNDKFDVNDQTYSAYAERNTVISYYIRLDNNSTTSADKFTVTGTQSGGGWTITYYDALDGGSVIDTSGDGWQTASINQSGYTEIHVDIEYDATVGEVVIKDFDITLTSEGSPSSQDKVRARV